MESSNRDELGLGKKELSRPRKQEVSLRDQSCIKIELYYTFFFFQFTSAWPDILKDGDVPNGCFLIDLGEASGTLWENLVGPFIPCVCGSQGLSCKMCKYNQ